MWCPNCQADVAAEVTAESQRVRCATCNTELHVGTPVRTGAKTEAARELLKRWANDDMFDPFGPLPGAARAGSIRLDELEQGTADSEPEEHNLSAERLTPAESPESPGDRIAPRPVFPFEDAHSSATGEIQPARPSQPTLDEFEAATTTPPLRAFEPQPQRPIDRPLSAETATSTPPAGSLAETPAAADEAHPVTNDVQAAVEDHQQRGANLTSFCGQILAYFGVAGLTVGTSLLLWGYFGGPAGYMSTGWLIATAGQMMLFLGVVTLVSGGMEQTTDEVARRIDRLGTRLLRIEQATRSQTVRGPHTPAEQYTGHQSSPRPTLVRERQSA